MGQAAALSGLIGLTGPLAIVLKPPPVTWLGLISANIGYFISAPFLSRRQPCTPPMHLPRPGLNLTIQAAATPAGSPRAIPVLTSTNRCDIAMTKIDTRFPVLLGLGLLLASGLVGQQSQLAGSVPTG